MSISIERIPSLSEPEEKAGYRRAQPGVLTFSREGEALYMDQRGAVLLDRIGGAQGFFSSGGQRLPQIILDLLVRFDDPAADGPGGNAGRVLIDADGAFLFRAVRLRHPDRHGFGRFLILIEEVSNPGAPERVRRRKKRSDRGDRFSADRPCRYGSV